MASRTIHLAVTRELERQYQFRNLDRLRFGAILPDAAVNRQEYARSHFKMAIGHSKESLCDLTTYKGERSYHLTEYRKIFGRLMQTDDLYLGYYLHLIQDLLYRHFIYERYHWNPSVDGSLERLYGDYRQINAYVIKKYGLKNLIERIKKIKRNRYQ